MLRPERRPIQTLGAAALLGGLALVAGAGYGVPTAIGARRSAMRSAAASSAHATAGRFGNHEPGVAVAAGAVPAILRAMLARGDTGRPARPVPLVSTGAADRTAAALAVTWFGHSSALIEIDGHRVLTDPVWSERASPSRLLGPRRLHPVPRPLNSLPDVDAVLISHDHYDHLDMRTILALLRLGAARFVVPVGIGTHLRGWGIPASRIVELDWDEQTEIGRLTLTCTRARHFSGRGVLRNTTQWASWSVSGPQHRVFFGGDTGYTTAFAEIGARLGPFELALLPVGAYSDLWPDVHMTPEEAVSAQRDLRAGLLVPVHWATFNLGFHSWSEPISRLCTAADTARMPLAVPQPGERIDIAAPPRLHDWWSSIG
jgi:L-ascorbate metabolism protein UlaG (beta-lactamase superfamily)